MLTEGATKGKILKKRLISGTITRYVKNADLTLYSIKEAVMDARTSGIPLEMEQIEEQTNQLIRGYVAYGGDTKQAKYLDDMIDDAKKAGIRLHPNVLELQLK